MTAKKQKLMIIDGNALIHRSFHALPPTMRTKSGEMTNAVYGFTTVLLKALRELKPDYVALTLDRAAPTFRHLEYSEYKATRVKAPDELYSQIPLVKKVAQVFNIPIYEKDGYEADDLIGTIASRTDGSVEKIILTGDLDTLQLVNSHTRVYTMSRGLSDSVIYNEAMVEERFGLKPEQMIDYKALRGDPSDNIPGVKGIGEKTATELLITHKTLDRLYAYIDKNDQKSGNGNWESGDSIKLRIADLLRSHKEMAYLSKKLATINIDSEIKFDLEASRFGPINQKDAVNLFSELEFKTLLPRIKDLGVPHYIQAPDKGEAGASPLPITQNEKKYPDKFERNRSIFQYQLIDNEKKFDLFLKKLSVQKQFTFDTETTSFDPLDCGLLGISFSWKENEAFFVSINNRKSQAANNQLDLFNSASAKKSEGNGHWLEKLKPIFNNGEIKKYGHNIKFDIRVMRHHGVETAGAAADTMIASYLLNPGSRQHNLDAVTFTELGFEKISKEDLLGKGKDKITFSQVPTDNLSLYSCEDADFTNRLVRKLRKQLQENNLEKLFNEIEMPLVNILSLMEDSGIKIDDAYLKTLSVKTNKELKKLQDKIWKTAGTEFNISSPLQLREILFDKLKISTNGISKTKTGISTAADELAKMKDTHEIIPLISDYRELSKLANTYIDSLPKLINKRTKRVHTSFNQAVTATGRLSSTEPNLQNIPVRTELGREIRKAFVAEKGYKFLSLDYSQIELRLAAHMSRDEKMIDIFKQGLDIHTATAAEINQVPLDEATKEMRREAKAINFGLLYGQGPRGLSQTADIPYDRAKKFIEYYFTAYAGVKNYIEESIESAREKGYAETLFGRRRFLPEINSSVMQVRKNAERMAINTPLQGTAADMIKAGMIKIGKEVGIGNRESGKIKMLLQVHDELLFEVKENELAHFVPKIKNLMENVIKLDVPIIVDASEGDNWGEMRKINK